MFGCEVPEPWEVTITQVCVLNTPTMWNCFAPVSCSGGFFCSVAQLGPGIKSGACCAARGLISGTGGGAGAGAGADGAAFVPRYDRVFCR